MWQSLVEQPIFVLTSDQDWAPSWASEQFLTLLKSRNMPSHFFRTNPCPILDNAVDAGEITQGWHPNFLPGSSHGGDIESVVSYMNRTFPGATTVRSHAFAESTPAWQALARAGIVADSQLATLYQPGLTPLLHCSGIVRFPIFFEDDVFFDYEFESLNLQVVKANLFTPGLKVFNFHATFVAANIPARKYYDDIKATLFAENSLPCRFEGRGTYDVFEELVQTVFDAGFKFSPFPNLVGSASGIIAANREFLPGPFGAV